MSQTDSGTNIGYRNPEFNLARNFSRDTSVPSYNVDAASRPVNRNVSIHSENNRILQDSQPRTNNDIVRTSDLSSDAGQYPHSNSATGSLQRNVSTRPNSDDHKAVTRNPPNRGRSKTPGPEFLRGSAGRTDMQDDLYEDRREPLRSKTPTGDLPGPQSAVRSRAPLSGTPDFIPASVYTLRPSRQQDVMTRSVPSGNWLPPNRSADLFSYSSANLPKLSSSLPVDSQPSNQVVRSSSRAGGGSRNIPSMQTSPMSNRFVSGNYNVSVDSDSVAGRTALSSWTESPVSGMSDSVRHLPSRANLDTQYFEMPVFLHRLESGFGFRIIGGTEEDTQVGARYLLPHFLC